MKKSNLIKVVSILLISVMVMLFSTTVNAANDNTGFNDLTSTLTNNNTAGNNTAGNNTAGNNTTINNTTKNNNNNNATKNNTTNSSIYNNTNLPKTGIGDSSIPVAMLVVIFGISAVYAYKKIKDYRNI